MSQISRVLRKKHSLFKPFVRFRKNSTKPLEEKEIEKLAKADKNIISYIESFGDDYKDIVGRIPNDLLKKYNKPDSIYLINNKTAKEIVTVLAKNINKHSPIVEVNPGFGILTKEMLKVFSNSIYLYESSLDFKDHLNKMKEQQSKILNIKYNDFYRISRLSYYDSKKEIIKLLENLATDDKDREITVVGALSSTKFLEYLLLGLIFHNSKCKLGKPDFYFSMLGEHFEKLFYGPLRTTGKNKPFLKYFDLFFDLKALAKVPVKHYVPWFTSRNSLKNEEFGFYLVNIKYKEELPVPASYLPLLWFYLRRNTFTSTTRVIPMLEQWIPGCGVRFICDLWPPGGVAELATDEKLPHLNIYTTFGDLDLKQQLLIFKRFVSMPEFEESAFRSTMESVAPKYASINVGAKKVMIDADIEDDQDMDLENVFKGENGRCE